MTRWEGDSYLRSGASGRGRDHLRIGDAERNRVTSALHEHFAQGRLDREELDERIDATLAAKTYGDLRPITADLPDLDRADVAASDSSLDRRATRRRSRGARWPRPALALIGLPIGVVFATMLIVGLANGFVTLLPLLFVTWFVLAMLGCGHRQAMHDRLARRGFDVPRWHRPL